MTASDFGRIVISVIIVVAFIGYVAALFVFTIPVDMKDVVNTAGGILGGAFVSVGSYWIGSSAGSTAKDRTISTLSTGDPPAGVSLAVKP